MSLAPPLAQHTRRPDELRQLIQACSVVVSHPPSPSSALTAFLAFPPGDRANYLPLAQVRPLDPKELQRVPLSTPPTPPRSTSPDAAHTSLNEAGLSKAGLREKDESDYPLILVTGGAGFIGSHTALEILQQGKYGVVVLDNLENSQLEVLHRVRLLSSSYHSARGLPPQSHPPLYFHACDIQDRTSLAAAFALYASPSVFVQGQPTSRIVAAVHFAALKSVAGSLKHPVEYYSINVAGTLALISTMSRWNVKRLVFSSSCVVYGAEAEGEGIEEQQCKPREGGGRGITNPYGRSKRMCEEIVADLCDADPEWRAMQLRYTNPSGAHPSGYIGEDPTNAANLMPLVTHVLQGKREHVEVYGADYDTPDGTGIRDFIHVVDLAEAHVAALDKLLEPKLATPERCATYNLGTNRGTSVLEIIETLSSVAQRPIKIVVSPRREGDLACVVCCTDKAEHELGWKAKRGVVEMCRDLVHWQAKNPQGYGTKPL